MTQQRKHGALGILLVALLAMAGCTGSESIASETDQGTTEVAPTQPDATTTTSGPEPSAGDAGWSALAQLAASDIEAVLTDRVPTWDGFDPAAHPTVVLLAEEDGSITTGFTVNHPSPDAVGIVEPVVGQDTVFYVSAFAAPVERPGNGWFGLDVEIGGVPSYVIVTDSTDEFAPAGSDTWRGLFLHEMFHLYQRGWTNQRFGGQDIEGYDLSPAGIQLILLEDAALAAALDAPTPDEAMPAIRQFVALRTTRLESAPTTDLDEQQEAVEGTAQWFEWRSIGRTEPMYGSPALGASLADPSAITGDPLLYLGFRRFYLTGATIMELLDRNGVEWLGPIEGGDRPAEILRRAVTVDPADRPALIEQARQLHDADGALTDLAQRWSEAAQAAIATGSG